MRNPHEAEPVRRPLSVCGAAGHIGNKTADESLRRFARMAMRRAALVELCGTVTTLASVITIAVTWLRGTRGAPVVGLALVATASAAVALRPWTLRALDVVGDTARGTSASFGEWLIYLRAREGRDAVRFAGASATSVHRAIAATFAVLVVAAATSVVVAATSGVRGAGFAACDRNCTTAPSPTPTPSAQHPLPLAPTPYVVSRDGGTGVVVRAANTTRSRRLGALSHRARVLVQCEALAVEGEPSQWFRIAWDDNGHAWVAARYLEAVERSGPVSRCS